MNEKDRGRQIIAYIPQKMVDLLDRHAVAWNMSRTQLLSTIVFRTYLDEHHAELLKREEDNARWAD